MATPVFCCGFECGLSASVGSHWPTAGGAAIVTTSPRTGARHLNCNGSNERVVSAAAHTSTTRHIGRFYIRFNTALPTAGTANVRLAKFNDDALGPAIHFKIADSKIYAGVSNTSGASGVTVTTGQWYLIDYDFNVNTSGTDTCDVRVNGTACGQATGNGTSTGGSTDAIGLCDAVTAADIDIDDVLLSSTAADFPLGAGKVEHFVPTSDGTHNVAGANDFERSNTGTDITNATTTAFQLIDDVPLKSGVVTEYINLIAPPNATNYVEVIFGPAPGISTPTAEPRAVDVIVAYASASAGTFNIRLALNDNGSLDDVVNTNTGPGTSATYARKQYADPPSAASVWGITSGDGNFNNVRMRCFTSDPAPDPWWASAMIEAEFAEVVVAFVPRAPYSILQAVNRSNSY